MSTPMLHALAEIERWAERTLRDQLHRDELRELIARLREGLGQDARTSPASCRGAQVVAQDFSRAAAALEAVAGCDRGRVKGRRESLNRVSRFLWHEARELAAGGAP